MTVHNVNKIVELNGGTDIEVLAQEVPKRRKIALVGTAASSRLDAPFDDESWEIWTLGCGVEFCKRIDKLFEVHTQHVLEEANAWTGLVPYLKKHGKDTILGHANSEFPDATPYPIEQMTAKYGRYFTSSIAYMLAYAIEQEPDAIGLWGIDMMGTEEYNHQRPCCEYLLGIARGKNITLVVADESPILRSERLYAFEHTALSAGINTMRKELKTAIAGVTANERKARDERKFYEGQMEMLENIHKRFG